MAEELPAASAKPTNPDVPLAVDEYAGGNYEAALASWVRLADQGNAFAQDFAAAMLSDPVLMKVRPTEASHYAQLAAEQGDVEAMRKHPATTWLP